MKPRRPDFAKRVRELICARHVTPRDVAMAMGVAEGTVVRWLRGELPKVEHLNKLASFLEVVPTDLLLDLAKFGFDSAGNLTLKAIEPRRDLLKLSDVCHLISVGESTLETYIRNKVFVPVDIRAPGNKKPSWRIPRADYDAFLQRKLKERAKAKAPGKEKAKP